MVRYEFEEIDSSFQRYKTFFLCHCCCSKKNKSFTCQLIKSCSSLVVKTLIMFNFKGRLLALFTYINLT